MKHELFENDRGYLRAKTNRDFLDSTWCYSKTGVFAQLLNKHLPAFVVDLSRGGLGFITDIEIEIDSKICVLIAYKDYRQFMMIGRVRHCRAFEPKGAKKSESNKKYYKIGLQFLFNDSEVMSEYSRLLKRFEVFS